TVNFSGDLVPGFTAGTPQTSNSRDIGTLTRQRLVSDGLGGGDVSDTYKFVLPHNGRLIATLGEAFSQNKSPITGILATDSNHNGLLDPGESIAQFDGDTPLNKSLAAGTYFITLFDGFHFAYELTLTPDFAGET